MAYEVRQVWAWDILTKVLVKDFIMCRADAPNPIGIMRHVDDPLRLVPIDQTPMQPIVMAYSASTWMSACERFERTYPSWKSQGSATEDKAVVMSDNMRINAEEMK